jgi:hypothetical protein
MVNIEESLAEQIEELEGENEKLEQENKKLKMALRHVRNVHASIGGMRELFPEHTELGAIQGQLEIAFLYIETKAPNGKRRGSGG